VAPTLAHARDAAYAGVKRITWTGAIYRNDIGARALMPAATPGGRG